MQFGDLVKLLIALKSNILPTGLYLIQSSSSWLRQPEALQHTISRAHDIRPSGSRTIREFEGVEIRKDANEVVDVDGIETAFESLRFYDIRGIMRP